MPDEFDAMVENLHFAHRRADALRRLMAAGPSATPAVRRGLRHESPAVRQGCCIVLDHFLDEAALPELLENLDHPHGGVRFWAVHALACDRCKEGSCRPGDADSVPAVIRLLSNDPSKAVRQQCVHLLAQAVHRNPEALEAMKRAHCTDPEPSVRKIAGWWVPGGVRYEKSRPKPQREARQG